MDIVALILAVVAVALFLVRRPDVGMAAVTSAWVCQLVHLTGTTLHV